jgi:hypothetical protein
MASIVSFTYCSNLREPNNPNGRSLGGREYRLIKEIPIPLDTHLRDPSKRSPFHLSYLPRSLTRGGTNDGRHKELARCHYNHTILPDVVVLAGLNLPTRCQNAAGLYLLETPFCRLFLAFSPYISIFPKSQALVRG